MKIGIPGGLLYFNYYPLWKTFFEELGAEVICSPGTNKNILDRGVKLCVDEACLPVKIYHGHVQNLADKVDVVFIPRIMSICKNEYICPKFCGLPEMVKGSVPGLPHIADTTLNLRKSESNIYDFVIGAGNIVTQKRDSILWAYDKALAAQSKFESDLRKSGDFDSAVRAQKVNRDRSKRKIAVIGHPYNVYDSYANMDIRKKLVKEGYSVVTPEMIDEARINRYAATLPKRHFWTFGRRVLGVGLSFLEQDDISGIIYLSSFGCGIDSLMEDYLERQIRRDGRIPYMKLTLDEHTGEAGMNTRIEAFLDMVKWREEDEGNISPYGGDVCGSKSFS